jgi:hypothetical protein
VFGQLGKRRDRAGLGAGILIEADYWSLHKVLGSVKAWVMAGFAMTIDEVSER